VQETGLETRKHNVSETGFLSRLRWRTVEVKEQQDLVKEISSLKSDLQLNCYPQGFIDSVINAKGSNHLTKEHKPLGSLYIPHVKGISETFKCIGN
jgi:hypothetical protein